jgi:hypothetical protein
VWDRIKRWSVKKATGSVMDSFRNAAEEINRAFTVSATNSGIKSGRAALDGILL